MRVEPLDRSRHNRKAFDCRRPELNDWLAHHAAQAQVRHNSARSFVLTEDGETILGYYALTSHSVDVDALSLPGASRGITQFPPFFSLGSPWQPLTKAGASVRGFLPMLCARL